MVATNWPPIGLLSPDSSSSPLAWSPPAALPCRPGCPTQPAVQSYGLGLNIAGTKWLLRGRKEGAIGTSVPPGRTLVGTHQSFRTAAGELGTERVRICSTSSSPRSPCPEAARLGDVPTSRSPGDSRNWTSLQKVGSWG
ncbi:hypothetical protein D623_10001703 [Myotis brandtii]|uniref:Uncharacterized protein n=1 Tax=Myotis brandtii TaxID=109478 RepID=S7PMH9_MYOBR|nr:hypothetical protein D623_10001703 [Myotis brandtii]